MSGETEPRSDARERCAPPIVALDVAYRSDGTAVAAAVLFFTFCDAAPSAELAVVVPSVAPYTPGRFFERELPCLLAVLERVEPSPRTVVIDGYVFLGPDRPGLGAHLHDALGGRVPVIGVAKTAFRGAISVPVLRGTSTRPLYVTAAGLDVAEVATWVREMHGPHRIPTLLRRVDALCRVER